jgi:hypothetical protein
VTELNAWLLDNLGIVLSILSVVAVGLVVAVAVVWRRLSRSTAAYRSLVHEVTGVPLGEVLERQAARLGAVDRRLGEIDGRYQLLEARTRNSLRHVGLVRFNPFEDTGSDQSFAIALLDDEGSGIVMSSLHGRAGTRVFAKPIRAGQAAYTLSGEEQEALHIASAAVPDRPVERDR